MKPCYDHAMSKGQFQVMVKIETRLLSLAPGKIEKMETTKTSDGGSYDFGSDYTHYLMRNSRCRSEDNTYF